MSDQTLLAFVNAKLIKLETKIDAIRDKVDEIEQHVEEQSRYDRY